MFTHEKLALPIEVDAIEIYSVYKNDPESAVTGKTTLLTYGEISQLSVGGDCIVFSAIMLVTRWLQLRKSHCTFTNSYYRFLSEKNSLCFAFFASKLPVLIIAGL